MPAVVKSPSPPPRGVRIGAAVLLLAGSALGYAAVTDSPRLRPATEAAPDEAFSYRSEPLRIAAEGQVASPAAETAPLVDETREAAAQPTPELDEQALAIEAAPEPKEPPARAQSAPRSLAQPDAGPPEPEVAPPPVAPVADEPPIEEPIQCGSIVCPAGATCCNASCGLCSTPGASCSGFTCKVPPYPDSVSCGRNTCNAGEVCCNPSCGTCVAPGDTCDTAAVCSNRMQFPMAETCGSKLCNANEICCNPSCGICAEPGVECSRELCQ